MDRTGQDEVASSLPPTHHDNLFMEHGQDKLERRLARMHVQ